MAGTAVAGAVRPLADSMGRGIPIIGQGIEVFHGDAGFGKGIPHRGDEPERRDLLGVARVFSQGEGGPGCGASA